MICFNYILKSVKYTRYLTKQLKGLKSKFV